MPRKRQKKSHEHQKEALDPRGFSCLKDRYLEWMRLKNYAESTIENRQAYLRYFIRWCEERDLKRPSEITRPILERYQRSLYYHRKTDGRPLSFRSQHLRLTSVRAFFRWLSKSNHILYNPASELELPRLEHRLPQHVLTEREAEKIISIPNIDYSLGIRDRAILEVFTQPGCGVLN